MNCDVEKAAAIIALARQRLRGLVLAVRPGSPITASLSARLSTHFTVIPFAATNGPEAVTGSTDWLATFSTGRIQRKSGLTALNEQHLIWVENANLLRADTAAALLQVLERPDRNEPSPLMALVFSPHWGWPPFALRDRLGLWLSDVSPDSPWDQDTSDRICFTPVNPKPECVPMLTDEQCHALSFTALELGLNLRADVFAAEVARCSAQLEGRMQPDDSDLALAVRTVLAPRAQARLEKPLPPSEATNATTGRAHADTKQPKGVARETVKSTESATAAANQGRAIGSVDDLTPAPAPSQAQQPVRAASGVHGEGHGDVDAGGERLFTAAGTSHPLAAQLLRLALSQIEPASPRRATPAHPPGPSERNGAAIRAGARIPAPQIGPHRRVVPWQQRRDHRIAIVPTVLAAVPWQRLRQASGRATIGEKAAVSGCLNRPSLLLRPEDLRTWRCDPTVRRLFILIVDASGSTANHRMGQTKALVAGLLRLAYQRRAQVALIGLSGTTAQLLGSPGTPLTRMHERLMALPNRGGTPLAAGLHLAAQLSRRTDPGVSIQLICLTDGNANVGLRVPTHLHPADRRRAIAAEIESLGNTLRALGVSVTVIAPGAAGRPPQAAQQLARTLRAPLHILRTGADATQAVTQAVAHSWHTV